MQKLLSHKKKFSKTFLFTTFCVIFFLNGCSIIEETHGANLRQLPFDKINSNSTQEDVQKILGSPSTKSSYGKETWYYISNSSERRFFEEDEMLSQDAIAISFDDTGKVDNIQAYGLDDARNFQTVKQITPTAGHELTIMEQLLGNVGKFNPKQ